MKKKAILAIMIASVIGSTLMAQIPAADKSADFEQKQIEMILQDSKSKNYKDQDLTPEQIKEKQQIKAEKAAKKLNLTDEQKKQFIPLMMEHQQKKMEHKKAVKTAHETFKAKEVKTPADYQKMLDFDSEMKVQNATLHKEYYQKLSQILPAEKVYQLSKKDADKKEKSQSKNKAEKDKKSKK